MKDLAYYKRLPYTRRVRIEDDGSRAYFVAFVEEIGGLEADGSSPLEAMSNLARAFDDYVEAMVSWGDEIPEPVAWPGPGFDPARIVRRPSRASGPAEVARVSDSTVKEEEREFEFA